MKKSVWILILVLIGLSIQTKASPQLPQVKSLPEALFSLDGKYSLIRTHDSLESIPVQAWTLYLNVSGQELSTIVPVGDTVYFVNQDIQQQFFPVFNTEMGKLSEYKIVNKMSKANFIEQYDLKIHPLYFEDNLELEIDTFHHKMVQAPFADTINAVDYTVKFKLYAQVLVSDSANSNLDSAVYVVQGAKNSNNNIRLFYDPQTNFYWIQSSIYAEKLEFKQKKMYEDTVILTELQKEFKQKTRFGRLFNSAQI